MGLGPLDTPEHHPRADPGLFFFFFFTHTHYPVQSLRISSSCLYPGTFTQQPSHYVQLGMGETDTWRESNLFGPFRCCALENGKWLAEELPKEGAGQEWPQPQSPAGPLRQPQAPPPLQANPLPPRPQAQQGARQPPPVHAGMERAEMGSDSAPSACPKPEKPHPPGGTLPPTKPLPHHCSSFPEGKAPAGQSRAPVPALRQPTSGAGDTAEIQPTSPPSTETPEAGSQLLWHSLTTSQTGLAKGVLRWPLKKAGRAVSGQSRICANAPGRQAEDRQGG